MERGVAMVRKINAYYIFTIIALTGLFTALAYGAGGDIIWQAGDVKAGKQEPAASAVDLQGNVIMTGYTGGVSDDYYTVKLKADGTGTAWTASHDKSGGTDRAVSVAVDSGNDVIVTGYVWNGVNNDIHTIKYNGSTGAVLWQHTYNGSANGNDYATAIALDSLNNIYIGGYSQNASGNDDYLLLKYGPSGGAPVWQAVLNGAANGQDRITSISYGIDGIAVTGYSNNISGVSDDFDILTVKYNFSGSKLWETRYSSAGTRDDRGVAVKMDVAGSVVVTGDLSNASNKDIYTVKYNGTTGAVLWQQTYDGGYDDEPKGLWIDSSGDAFVTGYTWTLAGRYEFYTTRLRSSDGVSLWTKTFGSGGSNDDMTIPTGILVDEAGDVFVTGHTYKAAAGNTDFQTIKYKKDDGTQLWQTSFDGVAGKDDEPAGIGLSPTGDIYVAGWSDKWTSGASDYDYYVIKYDPGLLNAPGSLTATTIATTSIGLSWLDNSSNEDGFRIERKTGELGTWAEIATVGAGVSTYNNTGLSTDTKYYFRVRAYNASIGNSHYSNEAHALTTIVTYGAPAWSYVYNGPGMSDDFASAIAVGPDNHPVVTGYSVNDNPLPSYDYYTIKLNRANAAVLWSDRYNDADDELDVATCVTVDSSNEATVSGYSSVYGGGAQNTNDVYTIKYLSTGAPEKWHSQYNGPAGNDDRSTAVTTVIDGSNNIIVVGYGKNASNNDDIYVLKYLPAPAVDGFGNALPLWAAIPYDGGGNDYPTSVAFSRLTGHVFVAGYTQKNNGGVISHDYFTAKYDAATGNRLWTEFFNGPGNGDDRAASIAVDTAGNAYVTGYVFNAAGNSDFYTIKYDGSSGARLWEKAYSGPAGGNDEAVSLRLDPIEGAVVAAGTSFIAPGNNDFFIIRYDSSNGNVIWEKNLDRSASDDVVTAMELDASGYIYVAGNTNNGSNLDMISVAYDFEGTIVGATTFNGAANSKDSASSIAVNTMGEGFVAGYSENAANNADYVILKYSINSILVPAPFSPTATSNYRNIDLNWVANTSGTTFRIERTVGLSSASSIWTVITPTPLAVGTTVYHETGLNPAQIYCYRIEAFFGSINSRKTETCAFTGPTLNTATVVSSSRIDLSWINAPDNSGYKVERKTGAGGTWTTIAASLPKDTVSYSDTGLTGATLYYYRISALFPVATSIPGNEQPATTIPDAPVLNAPAGITAAKVDLSWNNVAGETGYKIERKTGAGGTWAQIGTTGVNVISYSDTTVSASTLYYYRVKSYNASGDSETSNEQSATTLLSAPVLLTATTISGSQVDITWSDITGETGYQIQEASCAYSDTAPNYCTLYSWAYSGWYQVGATTAPDVTSYSRTGLNSGSAYKYRVVGTGSPVNSDPSNERIVWTSFTAPALTLSPASETSLTLTWSNISGETGYAIERKQGMGGTWAEITTPPNHLAYNTTTYTNTGLALQTEFCYRIKAFSVEPSGPAAVYSNEPCLSTPLAAPVLNNPTAASTTQINLSWNNVPGNTGYEVQRCTLNTPDNPENASNPANFGAWSTIGGTLPADTITYSSTGLTAGYTYRYRVRDTYTGGYSAWSNEKYLTTIPAAPVMSVPTAISTTQINPSWNNVNGETSYNLEWKEGAGGTWSAPVSIGQNVISYPHTGLNSGSVYYYRIKATSSGGESAYSNEVSQTTVLMPPTLNTLTGVTAAKIDLSWNNISGNTGYKVERSTDNTLWTVIAANAGQDVTTYSSTGLTAGTLYYYRVRALNSAGESQPSNVQSATTTPVATTITLSVISASEIDLSWPVVKGATDYNIERKTGTGGTWSQIGTVSASYQELYCGSPYPSVGCSILSPASSGYQSTGLEKSTEYCYQVKSSNSTGGDSAASAQQCATTSSMATPALSAIAETSMSIRLNWVYDPNSCVPVLCDAPDGFELEIQLWNGTWLPLANVGPGITTFNDTKVEPARQYTYRVRAYKGSDKSFYGAATVMTPVWQEGDQICH